MQIQFQPYQFKTRLNNGKQELWDTIRKKYVAITPEELVRQHLIQYLITEKKVAIGKIAVEKEIKLNGLKKRFDILVYDEALKPLLLAECKAPQIKLTQAVINQVANYNINLQVKYLLITNGIEMHIAKIDFENKTYKWVNDVVEFS